MKNKKLIIILAAIVIIIAALINFLLKPKTDQGETIIPENQQTSEQQQIRKTAEEAINKLQNFTDSTSEQYLNDLKPYLSDEMFASEQELAQVQKEFNDKQGFVSTQKYSVSKIELVEVGSEDGETMTYKVTGTRDYDDSQENDVTYLKYEKISNEWKITDIIPVD
jgi:preprotein translocase subunit SecF